MWVWGACAVPSRVRAPSHRAPPTAPPFQSRERRDAEELVSRLITSGLNYGPRAAPPGAPPPNRWAGAEEQQVYALPAAAACYIWLGNHRRLL